MTSLIPTVHLPWPILAHAIGLTFLGLNLTFRRSPPGPTSEVSSMLGIATTGLGLCYLSTAYVPTHENVLLYASSPVRMILAVVAGLKILVAGEGLSREAKKKFLVLLVYDGVGGLILGWWLGTWSGRVPGI